MPLGALVALSSHAEHVLTDHHTPSPPPPTAVDGYVMPSKADAAGCLAVMDLLAMHLCTTAESMSRYEMGGEVGEGVWL